MIRCVIISLLLLVSSAYAQNSRTWKDVDGREIFGAMVDKSDKAVTVRVDSKDFQIPLERLSQECRDYVENNIVTTPVILRVDTLSQRADTNDIYHTSGDGADEKTIRVDVSRVNKRLLEVEVVWIGNHRSNKRYGIFRVDRKPIRHDGSVDFTAVFGKEYDVDNDDDYKAYAVRVLDEKGNELARTATMKSYERFLDEAAERKEADGEEDDGDSDEPAEPAEPVRRPE
jgi:hypothetical protein